jgi:hypothetical protein
MKFWYVIIEDMHFHTHEIRCASYKDAVDIKEHLEEHDWNHYTYEVVEKEYVEELPMTYERFMQKTESM